jgi:predicted permease
MIRDIRETLHGFRRDLFHAARALAKARAFTVVCVVTLGIGMVPVIGIPWAAQLFLGMTPPGVDTDGLVELVKIARGPREPSDRWSYADFADLRDADTRIAMTGWARGQTEISIQTPDGVRNQQARTMYVSANFFRTLGVTLVSGAGFESSFDDPMRAEPVVILGYDGPPRSGPDLDLLGATVTVNGTPHVVVGIAPDDFSDHAGVQLFVPLERHPRLRDKNDRSRRDDEWINIAGRLSSGVSIEQAKAVLSVVTSRLAEQYPATNEFKVGSVEPYDGVTYDQRSELMVLQSVLFAMTGMVLLVVCLNISGMMQVRGAMRERELSVRQAIGASRGRLVQYLLCEAVILSVLGGVLSTVVLFNIPPVMAWWIGQPIPPEFQEALKPDLYIAAICVAVCLATSLLFGLLPALRFSRPAIISSLKDDAGGGGYRVNRVQRVAVGLQIGIALPFLVLSGMLVDRVRSTATADLGFETDGLAAVRLDLDPQREKENPGFFIRTVRRNLEQASGIASVTVADGLPLDFTARLRRVSRQDQAAIVQAHVTGVGEGYLNTMGIPLLLGRSITAEDRAGVELVAVISKSLADRLFSNIEAAGMIGQRLTLAREESLRSESLSDVYTIIGVTADFVASELSQRQEQLLLPLAQHPVSTVFLVARSAAGAEPMQLTAAFQNAVQDLDADFKLGAVLTGEQLRESSMRAFLSQSAGVGAPGGVVLALAALGIYGVVGLMVATRTREMALRMALGATRGRVLGEVLFDVVKLVIPGVAGGLLIAAVLVRMFREDLGLPLSNVEHLAYVAAAAIAVVVAVLASLAPARRAASVAPMVAMRSE